MKMNCSLNFDSKKVQFVLLVHSSWGCFAVVVGVKSFVFWLNKFWIKLSQMHVLLDPKLNLDHVQFTLQKIGWQRNFVL